MNSASSSNQPPEITVDSIVEPPVQETELSLLTYELEVKQTKLDSQKLLNEELRRNIEGRSDWAERVFWLIIGWLLSVIGVVACQGFAVRGFHLDNSVVLAFIGTTTVNVLSLGYIVAHYLFPTPK
jgi:hypothetical protein